MKPHEDLRHIGDIPGFDTRPAIDPESASELDKLIAEKTGEPSPGDKPQDAPPGTPPGDKPQDAPPADKPADKPQDTPPADKPGDKPQDTPPADKSQDIPPAKDDFDAIQLPPYTSKKASESFDALKASSREKISAAQAERDAMKKERDEAIAKASAGIPKEVEAELKELRDFRNKMDVEADPQFKSFDKTVSDNIEAIYARMKTDGFTDDQIAKVKSEGGPGKIDWDRIADKLPLGFKRFIDVKLVENESLLDKKNRAVAEAKANAEAYLKSKADATADVAGKQNKRVEAGINEMVPQLGWLEERKAKADAKDDEKKSVEAHNTIVKESKEFLAQAINDSSPELRSLLAVGYIQLLKLRADHKALKAERDATVKGLETKLKETTDLLDRVKKASPSRLPSTPGDATPTATNLTSPNTTGGEAIDTLLKEKMASR